LTISLGMGMPPRRTEKASVIIRIALWQSRPQLTLRNGNEQGPDRQTTVGTATTWSGSGGGALAHFL
jgi:hypothetical protein